MEYREKVQNVLNYINPTDCTYTEWIQVGQALHHEGCDVSLWDNWSKRDPLRYQDGECQKKWDTFGQCSSRVTGRTLIHMAQRNGYWVKRADLPFADNSSNAGHSYRSHRDDMPGEDTIDMDYYKQVVKVAKDKAYQEKEYGYTKEEYTPLVASLELAEYLNILFKRDEYVGYCVNTVVNNEGRRMPVNSNYMRTAGELIDGLMETQSVEEVFGTIDEEAGAWIHINPCDGKGVKAENVTDYRYALIESDVLPLGDQEEILRTLNLPIKVLVYSGNKSLHAIVSIDARNAQEYRERIELLYNLLDDYGFIVDRQNKNPNRMSRMPGVLRGGKSQNIVAFEIGEKNWTDWESNVYLSSIDMPNIECTEDVRGIEIPNKPELIKGVLRRGHKMNLTGPSKAGKTFLLLELAIALSRGRNWLGFDCNKSKVLYINFELDRESCLNRIKKIEEHLGYTTNEGRNLYTWNLRGHSRSLYELVEPIAKVCKTKSFDVIVIDPIYKIMMGDENNATQMGEFCNELDRITKELDCSVIYCHHHSKGSQTQKKVIDRSSGSGVFSRDPDAIIDLLEIDLEKVSPEQAKEQQYTESTTAWRIEGVLRDFPGFAPKYATFSYPLHIIDDSGFLKDLYSGKNPGQARKKTVNAENPEVGEVSSVMTLKENNMLNLRTVVREMLDKGCKGVDLNEVANHLGIVPRTIRNYVVEMDDLEIRNGRIYELPQKAKEKVD